MYIFGMVICLGNELISIKITVSNLMIQTLQNLFTKPCHSTVCMGVCVFPLSRSFCRTSVGGTRLTSVYHETRRYTTEKVVLVESCKGGSWGKGKGGEKTKTCVNFFELTRNRKWVPIFFCVLLALVYK